MTEILLHSCCAPCSSAIIEWLLAHDYRPTVFYYNPNIYPEAEYLKRKEEITRYAMQLGLYLIDGDYDHDNWLGAVQGLEDAPERGARCLQCFKHRMLAAAKTCQERGIEVFTTTLSSSRWKSLEQIAQAGHWAAEQVGQVRFDDRNWRKGGLQQRRDQLLKEQGFYNQLYCGCEFSMRRLNQQ